jgi:hypothetical protein
VLAELLGEAIAGPLGGHATEGVRKGDVLTDERRRPCPGRDRVERLDEACAYHRVSAVAFAARPAKHLKLAAKSGYFGGAKKG